MAPDERFNHAAIRIVIAEDQTLVRRGAALLLSMESDMEVVGQACNDVAAVELAQVLHPDVILMDLYMRLKGGVAATREITRALPGSGASRDIGYYARSLSEVLNDEADCP